MRTRSISSGLSRSANQWPLIASLALSLGFLAGQPSALGAEGSVGDRPPANYTFVIEITPKQGPAERFSFVSAGGRLEVSFISGESEVNGTSIPLISSLKADFEPLPDGKVHLNQLTLMRTIPYVTGFTEGGAIGGRTRTITRSADGHGASANAGEAPDSGSQPTATRVTNRSVSIQQANAGISTSVVLTVGKPVTLLEDGRDRVRLTVNQATD
jgi:hypothetical protein